jgi:hypothetical protein
MLPPPHQWASGWGANRQFAGLVWQWVMTETQPSQNEIDQFILDRIESVPHLEALLLVWKDRPKAWSLAELAERLYVQPQVVQKIMQDLVREELLVSESAAAEMYSFPPESRRLDPLIQAVDQNYRRELVRVSNLIHSKPSAGVREFARAFRLTKEQD